MKKSTQIFTITKYQKKVLILIVSVFKTGKSYNSHFFFFFFFLEECKYVVKEKRIP